MKRPSAALVISVVALAFAMTGTGIAATHYLITKTSQISPSVLAKLKGKTGDKGTPGATGATGAIGSVGLAGSTGAAGINGANGANGANGTSARVANEAAGTNCANGGAKLTDSSGDVSYVCDGANGTNGTNASVASSDFQLVDSFMTLTPGGSNNVTAACPSGTVPTGGGYSNADPSDTNLTIWDNNPYGSPVGWRVGATLSGAASSSDTIYAYVICETVGS